MDNQQTELTQEQEIALLEQQLKEAVAAEQFFSLRTGQLWVELAEKEITNAIRDITSDKYEKDHVGYIKRLADLQAYKRMLRKIQVSAAPVRKAKIVERLKEQKGGSE